MVSSASIDSTPLYNSSIIDTYIRLIKQKYSYINVSELLSYAGMESYQVGDQGHWFTQEQVDLFYEKLEALSGNKHIAREAGRYAASPESLGVMRQYLLGLMGPSQAFAVIQKAAANFTKSSVYESKIIGSHKVEIVVRQREGVHEKPFQCENRMGFFEAVSMMFNYGVPKIEHPECLFAGGETCCYIISWKESRAALWKRVRNTSALGLSAVFVAGLLSNPAVALSALLPVSCLIILVLSLCAAAMEKKDLTSATRTLWHSTDMLLEQINTNYNNALMINEIGQALSKQTDLDGILSEVTKVLEKRLDYGRGLILLADKERTHLSFRAGFGYGEPEMSFLKNMSLHLDKPASKGVMVVSFRDQKPFLVNDINDISDSITPRSLEIARKLGVKSFICCPIVYEGESLGIIAVDNVRTRRPLTQSDMNLLMGVAPQIGIYLHNAMLLDARERQFKSIIQVLAATIDARDPITAGHSERVTGFAMGICREMQLPEDYCEMVRIASLLHDYGKIGVDDSILKKSGRLTPEEYNEIKAHADKTRHILEQINFEGIYSKVPEIASGHHEKIDGSGYPKGLKGENIPMGARIIAVADFFEALTSMRHYREPMPAETAFGMLKDGAGVLFDEEVVEALVRYWNKLPAEDAPSVPA